MKKAQKHLLEVCQGSELKGLKYHCYLVKQCPNSKCTEPCPITFATYNKGKEEMAITVKGTDMIEGKCSKCKKIKSVSKIM